MDAKLKGHRWRGVAFACTLLALAAASVAPASPPVRGGRLVVGLRAEPKHFNPLAAIDRPTRQVLGLLMADLVRIDRQSHVTAPNVARSFTRSEDGKTFTLELEPSARFSDGHPMDADDVVFSFEAYLDERTGSPQRDLLRVGGEPILVSKLDARRVRVELAEPYAAGDRLFDSVYILPRHRLEQAFEDGTLGAAWPLSSDPSDVVGLGPFRLKEIIPGERFVLERNPYYWKKDDRGASLPYLDELVFEIGAEETEAARLRNGELHLVESMSPRTFRALSASPNVRALDLGPGFEYNLLVFNLNDEEQSDGVERARRKGWFRNPHFRRAVSLGVDRRAIVHLVYGGRGAPLATHVTPGNSNWVADLRPDSNSIESAKGELSRGGFRTDASGRLVDRDGVPVRFSILTSASNEDRKKMAAIVQEDLHRLGMEVNVTTLEFRSFVERVFQGKDYDACLLGLGGTDADPNPEMSLLRSSGAMHVWRLGASSPIADWEREIDELMVEQATTLDPARRRAKYHRVQALVAEHLPFVSLASPHVLVAHDARLSNLRPGVLPPYTLWNAEELFLKPLQ